MNATRRRAARRLPLTVALAAAVTLAVTVGGCAGAREDPAAATPAALDDGAGTGQPGAAPGAPTTAPGGTAPPATTAAGTDPALTLPGATATGDRVPDATVLVEGRHAAILLAVDPVRRTARFDVIQFLTGDAANKAAAEDGRQSPVPNGYYTRNRGDRLRTLPVARDAAITVNALALGQGGGGTARFTLDELATRIVPGDRPIFWLTVRANTIVRMQQQYVP